MLLLFMAPILASAAMCHRCRGDILRATTEKRTLVEVTRGTMSMIDITTKAEEIVLGFDVCDEALEIAAGPAKENANFTLGACTGLSECPA